MSNEAAVYNYLSCSAKIDNLLHPRCGFLSDGGWDDLDTVRKRALVAGWTSPTKTADLCPIHSTVEAPVAPTRSRSPRHVEPAQPTVIVTTDSQQ